MRVYQLAIEHAMKDFKTEAKGVARAGTRRAEYMIDKIIREQMELLRRLREERERRLAHDKMMRELREKWSSIYASELLAKLHEHMKGEGLQAVLRYREYLKFLELRAERVVKAFEHLTNRLFLRQKATILSRAALDNLIVPNVFRWHVDRQAATLQIQCAYRILMAKRRFLMRYIIKEGELLQIGKDEVWQVWKARLLRAVASIQKVETEQHRRVRRIVWARTEYARKVNAMQIEADKRRIPVEPESVECFKKPYEGVTAINLPNTRASKIVAPIGEDAPGASKLNWVGVPVGIAERRRETALERSRAAGQHYQLIHQPAPSYLFGCSLKDKRSRVEAQAALEKLYVDSKLREQNLVQSLEKHRQASDIHLETHSKLQSPVARLLDDTDDYLDSLLEKAQADLDAKNAADIIRSDSHWYDSERAALWGERQSLLL
jgi:hypothetical protein